MRHFCRSIEIAAALAATFVCVGLVTWANTGPESEPMNKGFSETASLERQLDASICTTRVDVVWVASAR